MSDVFLIVRFGRRPRLSREIDQLDAIFKGRVQGVGFRHNARQIATRLSLVGIVRNLESGEVEIIAQGPKKQLQELIDQLKSRFDIQECRIVFSVQNQSYSTFSINH